MPIQGITLNIGGNYDDFIIKDIALQMGVYDIDK